MKDPKNCHQPEISNDTGTERADQIDRANVSQPARRRRRRQLPESLRDSIQVDANQFADLIGISKRQLFRWMSSGHVPPYDLKIGQTCRWNVYRECVVE
jgi:DNA-binding transcriptional regulator YiaG